MRGWPVTAVVCLFLTAWCQADGLLYRYEGDVVPYDASAGWIVFNPCEPPCSESVENGHFVLRWPGANERANYHRAIASTGAPQPPTLWVEWRFRSNHPLGTIFFDCDGRFRIVYDRIEERLNIYGDAAISGSGDDFILGININELHTYRFESLDGMRRRISVDGHVFIDDIKFLGPFSNTFIQLFGGGGCDTTRPDEVVNEWDYVRYGTISFGEQIVSTDPPAGVLDETIYANLDRFTVTFDAANYVYIDDITVEVIPPPGEFRMANSEERMGRAGPARRTAPSNRAATVRERTDRDKDSESASYTLQEAIALRDRFDLQGPISSRSLAPRLLDETLSDGSTADSTVPVVIATRRLDNDEPSTVEIVLDRPMPVGQITRFTFNDGTTTNVVDYGIGLPDADGDGVTDSADQCPGEDDRIDANNNGTPDCLEPPIPAVNHWGLLILALFLLAIGAASARRRTSSPRA